VEKISDRAIRVTLVADVQISGTLNPPANGQSRRNAAGPAASVGAETGSGAREHEFLTVEDTAEILQIGRDKVYYLIRTGQLRSIKIGKLRRISRAWIADFVERLSAERA
jgi:excisionase family DNA binding protein